MNDKSKELMDENHRKLAVYSVIAIGSVALISYRCGYKRGYLNGIVNSFKVLSQDLALSIAK